MIGRATPDSSTPPYTQHQLDPFHKAFGCNGYQESQVIGCECVAPDKAEEHTEMVVTNFFAKYNKVRPHAARLTPHASRLAPHAFRPTPHANPTPRASRLTPHASRLAPHASRLTPHASRPAPRAPRPAPHSPRPTPHTHALYSQTKTPEEVSAALAQYKGKVGTMLNRLYRKYPEAIEIISRDGQAQKRRGEEL